MQSIQKFSAFLILLCCSYLSDSIRVDDQYSKSLLNSESTSTERWTGKFFPSVPPKDIASTTESTFSNKRISMGVANDDCDNAKKSLEVDWDGGPYEYTCYDPLKRYMALDVNPIVSFSPIPQEYSAPHRCMNETIEYDGIPTFGPHRPLWPRYGEYLYAPPQRWVHNLEHGAVVMLYHPCADRHQIHKLREIVQGCLYRHVITPSLLLDSQRPFALVTWGRKLTLSTVVSSVVKNFIREHALKGPEKVYRDGQYDLGLKLAAKVVSDISDSELCPHLKTNM